MQTSFAAFAPAARTCLCLRVQLADVAACVFSACPQVVELSEEDQAAIARLAALGFERNMCIEAYLACDKNEEMAANYLAESMFD